jgi:hypothetical protein
MTIITLTEDQARIFRGVELPVDLVDSKGRFVGRAEPVSKETAKVVDAILKARRDQEPLPQ